MKNRSYYLILLLIAACTTKDTGGCSGVDSGTAEGEIKRTYGVEVTCIVEDGEDDQFLCASRGTEVGAEKLFRCAKSAQSDRNIKCIPWFSTE
jgi:hypothetical protein